MSQFSKGRGRHSAGLNAANGTAYILAVLVTILGTGPLYNVMSDPFVGYVTGYYGTSFAGFAALFLFVLLLALIFGVSTFTFHTLIEALRAKVFFFLSRFK